jgi:hypothetical protein
MKLEIIRIENKDYYQFRDGDNVGEIFSISHDIENQREKWKEN